MCPEISFLVIYVSITIYYLCVCVWICYHIWESRISPFIKYKTLNNLLKFLYIYFTILKKY